MKTLLFVIAAMMVAGWMVSLLFFTTGMFIHILLMVALFLFMQAIIISPKTTPDRH